MGLGPYQLEVNETDVYKISSFFLKRLTLNHSSFVYVYSSLRKLCAEDGCAPSLQCITDLFHGEEPTSQPCTVT